MLTKAPNLSIVIPPKEKTPAHATGGKRDVSTRQKQQERTERPRQLVTSEPRMTTTNKANSVKQTIMTPATEAGQTDEPKGVTDNLPKNLTRGWKDRK